MVLIKNEYAAVGLHFNEKCILPAGSFFPLMLTSVVKT